MDCMTSAPMLTRCSRTALQNAGQLTRTGNLPYDYASLRNHTVDTLRVIARYQNNISASDLSTAFIVYDGPPEGADVLLSHSLLPFERFDITEDSDFTPPLAIALRCYSQSFFLDNTPKDSDYRRNLSPPERKQWEPLIRRFIGKDADLHVPVPCIGYNPRDHSPFHVNDYGTPLDVLFEFSTTPDEARTLGAEWLTLLASKGHNVVAYLKKELMLHSTQHHMTYPALSYSTNHLHSLRELHFTFDEGRSFVWWEWWIDPASDLDIMEVELKEIAKYTPAYPWFCDSDWISPWPFRYPDWHYCIEHVAQLWAYNFEDHRRRDPLQRAYLVMQRANRRHQKRSANSTRSKASRHPQMPGAWPAS